MRPMKEEVWKDTDCPFVEGRKCKMYKCIAFSLYDSGPQYTNEDYTLAYCSALGEPYSRRY